MTTQEILSLAKEAKASVMLSSTETKNRALEAMAEELLLGTEEILAANAQDLEAAKGTISEVMLDRLALSRERIEGMAQGIREVVTFSCSYFQT